MSTETTRPDILLLGTALPEADLRALYLWQKRRDDEITALRSRVAELEAALRRLIDAPRYPCNELHEAFRHAEKVAP